MKKFLFSLTILCGSFSLCFSQSDLGYQVPDKAILDLADVKMPPNTVVNEDGSQAIMLYRDQYKTIAELSEKEMRLGGLRINPVTNINSRQRYFKNATLYDMKKGKERKIKGLPDSPRLSYLTWNRDQSMFAVANTTDKGVELWVVNMKTATAKRLTEDRLNGNMGRPFTWSKDGTSLLVLMLPDDRKDLINQATAVPVGPTVSANEGQKAQNRTYQDLLKNPTDEHNFEQLAKSTLVRVDLNGNSKLWKETSMYRGFSFSPDGKYVLVSEIKRPFSYIVPYYRFPYSTTVYDASGKKVKEILDAPLEEERPKGFMSTTKERRSIQWRADKPASLVWAIALDGGDPAKEVTFRDEVHQLDAPFNGEPTVIVKTIDRFRNITWGNDDVAVATDIWWNTRKTRTYLFNPSDISQKAKVLYDFNYQDRYSDPGSFVTKRNQYGSAVLALENDKLFLEGDGYSAEGILPFVDELDMTTLETNRLWRAKKSDHQENIVKVLDPTKGLVLERIESPSEFPNYYIRDIKKKSPPKQVTNFANPFKALGDVHKEVIKYKREDGLELSATLYLPAGYDKAKKEKLPMLMWAYPREYKDKSSAAQITSSDKEFIYPYYGSPIYWVARGYAVLDAAAFPIVGEDDEEPNDTFIPQLVANAKAAIDAVDDMGYIDRHRVGVGGHSYGAFMTANLLTHSDLFAAGIARSGAYNRSLTPFGFQSEERNFWEGADVYYKMSPFMNADKMKHPLLLIHGEADNNSGTYPMQSERYFNALKGLGATVRLVMLPKESHGYSAKESIMHMLWEQDQWLEKYVKNREKISN